MFALCQHPLFFLGLLLPWAAAVAKGSAAALALAGFVHAAALGFLYGTEVWRARKSEYPYRSSMGIPIEPDRVL